MKQKLIDLIRKLSYEKRNVKLASGRESNFYIDMKHTLLHPIGASLVGSLVFEKIKALRKQGQNIVGVGGLTMGADPISTAASVVSSGDPEPLFAFYIRKEPKGHGTQEWVEGMKNFNHGDKVVIVEDVVTTGGSTLKSVERARLAGLDIVGVITVVDREEGGAENILKEKIFFESLVKRSEIEK